MSLFIVGMNCCLLAEEADINGTVQNSNIGNIKQSSSSPQISGLENGKKKKKEQNDCAEKKATTAISETCEGETERKYKKFSKKSGTSKQKKKKGRRRVEVSKTVASKPHKSLKLTGIKGRPTNQFNVDVNHFNQMSFAMAMSNVQLGFGAINELLEVYKSLK